MPRVVDIDLLTPKGTVAAYQNLVEQGVHVLAQSFAIIPQPAMDVAVVTGTPSLNANTSQATLDLIKSDPAKYRNVFHIDVAETWYGAGLIRYLKDAEAGGWVAQHLDCGAYTPKARKDRKARREMVFDIFSPLRKLEHALVGGFRGGEWRMVSVGRALFALPRDGDCRTERRAAVWSGGPDGRDARGAHSRRCWSCEFALMEAL